MLELTPTQRKLLRKALVSSYRKYDTLRIFVSENFKDIQLDEIGSSQALQTVADDLITHFQQLGDVCDLVEALIRERPRNPQVLNLKEQILPALQASAELQFLETQVSPEQLIEGQSTYPNSIVVRETKKAEALIEPENYAHLVVAIFWEGERKLRKFRACPKLCCRDHATQKVFHTSLGMKDDTDQYSVTRDKMPEFLKNLYSQGIIELRELFPDMKQSWRLSIELFLPVELLCLPITIWCGQDGDLLRKYPILVGCSDRFDPSRPGQAIVLHNQLQMGWERFLQKVPDQVGSTLQHLDWLDSNRAKNKSLAAYAGFRCYGNWLVPGEWEKLDLDTQKRWQDLIEFGIPLALWICQGNASRQKRATVYNQLINGTRYDLLAQIPITRDAQWKTNGHCVGVFYEDLDYLPELPKPREQTRFSWPSESV